PWNSTEVWLADLDAAGNLMNARRVAGNGKESIFQPQWSSNGILHFVSDRTGWWNLYALPDLKSQERERVVIDPEPMPLAPMPCEFGTPQWIFGMSTYALESSERIICTYNQNGVWHLAAIKPDYKSGNHHFDEIETPYTEFSFVSAG